MPYTNAIDLGDGRYQFNDDAGQQVTLSGKAAADKARELGAAPAQLSPDIAAAAAPPPEARTADLGLGMLPSPSDMWNGAKTAGRKVADAAGPAVVNMMGGGPPAMAPAGPPSDLKEPTSQFDAAKAPQGRSGPGPSIAFSGGAGAGQTVPAGWVPHSMSIQKAEPLPESVGQHVERGYLMEKHALQDAAVNAKDRASAELDVQRGQQEAEAQFAAEQRTKVACQQAAIREMQAKYEKLADAVSNQKIDPDQFMGNRSTWSRMGIIMAQAGGAFASGINGGPNQAMELVNREVMNNIDAQKANLQNRKDGLAAQGSLMRMVQDNFQTTNQQDAALQALGYKAAQAKLATIATQFKGPEEQARLQTIGADLERKQAEAEMKLAQASADHITMTQAFQPKHTVGGTGVMENLNRSLVVDDGKGGKVLARSEEEARDLNKKAALTKLAVDAANKMHTIASKSNVDKLDPTSPLGQQFAAAQEQFVNAANSLQEQGVVRGEDIERYTKITGGKYGLATAEMATALAATTRRNYAHQVGSKADTEVPVAEGMVRDPKTGTIKRVARYNIDKTGRPVSTAAPVDFTPSGGGE